MEKKSREEILSTLIKEIPSNFLHYSDLLFYYSVYVCEGIQNDQDLQLDEPKNTTTQEDIPNPTEKQQERMYTRSSTNLDQKVKPILKTFPKTGKNGKKLECFTNEEIDAIVQGITKFGWGKRTQVLAEFKDDFEANQRNTIDIPLQAQGLKTKGLIILDEQINDEENKKIFQVNK
jgi:hypothetical protein